MIRGTNELYLALLDEDIIKLEQFFKDKIDVNLSLWDSNDLTALHIAVAHRRVNSLIWLLQRYPDLVETRDKRGNTPLHAIASGQRKDVDKDLEIMQLLIDCGANVQTCNNAGRTLLHSLTINYKPLPLRILQYCLEREDPIDIKMKDKEGGTVLHVGMLKGCTIEVVEYLIEKGADIHALDNKGRTALHYAASFDFFDPHSLNSVKYLVKLGLDPNKKDGLGCTPLHYAVKRMSTEVAEYFLTQTPNAIHEFDNEGNTPLHLAVQQKSFCLIGGRQRLSIVELLLRQGARNDAYDKQGRTPLHCAVFAGDIGAVYLLLESRIAIEATDHRGLTAAQYAESYFKLIKPTSEIYELFDIIQDNEMKKSLLEFLYEPVCRGKWFTYAEKIFNLFSTFETFPSLMKGKITFFNEGRVELDLSSIPGADLAQKKWTLN